jgi:hypothetical protein
MQTATVHYSTLGRLRKLFQWLLWLLEGNGAKQRGHNLLNLNNRPLLPEL